jgi:hypothetical protein
MQEEVLTSISDIDKTRKLYFEEEHLAKQARDKEDKSLLLSFLNIFILINNYNNIIHFN